MFRIHQHFPKGQKIHQNKAVSGSTQIIRWGLMPVSLLVQHHSIRLLVGVGDIHGNTNPAAS